MNERDKLSNQTINLGLGSNILLAIIKTLVGIVGHSSALLADGINSTSDVVYYIAVKIFIRQANKPADAEHPYGHRQLESISAIVVGAFILTTGITIFWEAINSMYDLYMSTRHQYTVSLFAVVVATITFGLKLYLYFYTKRNQKATQNPTLRALANDHLNDVLASVAVVIGVIGSRIGLPWADPLAGAFVSLFIIRTGIGIIMQSSTELMDTYPDATFRDDVIKTAGQVPGVKHTEVIGMHRFGPYFTINLDIGVDGNLTISQGHAITDEVETVLLEAYSVSLKTVHVHYHPVEFCSED
jgi:cation diffusion facilitator family transporter